MITKWLAAFVSSLTCNSPTWRWERAHSLSVAPSEISVGILMLIVTVGAERSAHDGTSYALCILLTHAHTHKKSRFSKLANICFRLLSYYFPLNIYCGFLFIFPRKNSNCNDAILYTCLCVCVFWNEARIRRLFLKSWFLRFLRWKLISNSPTNEQSAGKI